MSVLVGVSAAANAEPRDKQLSIDRLVKAGWQVAGYTGAFDGRSSFILFRHPSETYLIQCRAGYDVTREPRVTLNCYELH